MGSEVLELRDRERIARYLRRDVGLHLYEIGDLDDFFWPQTRWFALPGPREELAALALLYQSAELPVLLAFGEGEAQAPMLELLERMAELMPARLYSHLSPGLGTALADRFASEPHGRHLKMMWTERSRVDDVDTSNVVAIGREHTDELDAFYRKSYPGNWFDPRMLDTGQYFCAREAGTIIAIGGVHVYSAVERVAALGNVATSPSHRGRGIATRLAARICRSLGERVDHVGLNVEADNGAAVACYAKLGFREVARYDEAMLVARS